MSENQQQQLLKQEHSYLDVSVIKQIRKRPSMIITSPSKKFQIIQDQILSPNINEKISILREKQENENDSNELLNSKRNSSRSRVMKTKTMKNTSNLMSKKSSIQNSARLMSNRSMRKSKGTSPSPRNQINAEHSARMKKDDGLFSSLKLMDKSPDSSRSKKGKELNAIVNIKNFFNEIDNKKNFQPIAVINTTNNASSPPLSGEIKTNSHFFQRRESILRQALPGFLGNGIERALQEEAHDDAIKNQFEDNDKNQINTQVLSHNTSHDKMVGVKDSFDVSMLDKQQKDDMLDMNNVDDDVDDDESNAHNKHSRVMKDFSVEDDIFDAKRLPKSLLSPTSNFKLLWNLMMFALIIFIAVVVPYRIPFEDETSDSWFIIDTIMDAIFLTDIVLTFITAYEDENGILVIDKAKIASNYLKAWFTIDFISSIPITLISKVTQDKSGQFKNIKFLKLSRLPRLYRLLRLIKLMKLYRSNKFLERIVSNINISQATHKLFNSLISMIFLLHMIGCIWSMMATMTFGDYPTTWIVKAGLQDSPNVDQYLASVYWAATTIYTVGYGDIVAQNDMEILGAIALLFVGVSMYTYIFSKMSTLFSSVNSNESTTRSRDDLITDLAQKHHFTDDLTKKIQYFFQVNTELISLSKEYEIDELLKILPAHLKSDISKFLYKDAIDTLRLLQDRDMRFYGDYLSKLEPMRIKEGTVFSKEGNRPQEVFFLLKGCVECSKQRYYLEGTMFGETDIIFKRERMESYTAKCDCYILKLERSIFEQIMEEFPDIREDVEQIAGEREIKRLECLQADRVKQDPNKDQQDLQSLVSKIQKIQKRLSAAKMEKSDSLQSFFISENSNLRKRGPRSQARSSSRVKKQGSEKTQLQKLKSEFNDSFITSSNVSNFQTVRDVNKGYDPKLKNKLSDKQLLSQQPNKDQDYGQSPEIQKKSQINQRLSNIENIKNEFIVSISKDFNQGINIGRIEDRIQETKEQIRKESMIKKIDIMENNSRIVSPHAEYVEEGYESGRLEKMSIHQQIRQSIQKVEAQMTQEGFVIRQKTIKDKPVLAGNNQEVIIKNPQSQIYDEDEEEKGPVQQEISILSGMSLQNSQNSQNNNNNPAYNQVECDIEELTGNISNCKDIILNAKNLITEYSELFQDTIHSMDEDANEIIRRHYEYGGKGLVSYLSIMNDIEKLINGVNLKSLSEKARMMHTKSYENEKRFYFIENKVKLVSDILARKIRMIEKEREANLRKKPLIIVKRNPLLDTRDEKHSKMHEKLSSQSPMNL